MPSKKKINEYEYVWNINRNLIKVLILIIIVRMI